MTAPVFTVSVCRECGLPVHADDCRFFGTLRASLAPSKTVEVISADDHRRAVEAYRDSELRQALTLTACDALAHTDPLTPRAKAAILALLHRLVSGSPLDVRQEGEWIKALVESGCELTPPFERTVVGRLVSDRWERRRDA